MSRPELTVSTSDDSSLTALLAHVRSMPELTGMGLEPAHDMALRIGAQRCIAVARGSGADSDRELVAWVGGLLLSVIDGDVPVDQARLGVWASLRHSTGKVHRRTYVALVSGWNALQHGRRRLQVPLSGRAWDGTALRTVVYDTGPRGERRKPSLVRLQDIPLTRLADLAGYYAAAPVGQSMNQAAPSV